MRLPLFRIQFDVAGYPSHVDRIAVLALVVAGHAGAELRMTMRTHVQGVGTACTRKQRVLVVAIAGFSVVVNRAISIALLFRSTTHAVNMAAFPEHMILEVKDVAEGVRHDEESSKASLR